MGEEGFSNLFARNGLGRREFLFGSVAALTAASFGLAGCSQYPGSKKANTADQSKSGQAGKSGITITDQAGKTITLDKVPERVVTTIMPLPSIFYAVMGADNEVLKGCNPASMPAYRSSVLAAMYPSLEKANTDWCARDFNVNIEALLALKPDVVLQWTFMPESIKKMEDAGLKVIALKYGTVDDLKAWITILATMMQKNDRAKFLIDYYDKQISEVTARTNSIATDKRPVALHLYDSLKVFSGFSNYWMENSGSVNPAKDFKERSAQVNMEQIISWQPEFVYISNFTKIRPSDLYNNTLPGQDWSQIPAVKHKHVYKIPIGGYRWDPPCMETPLMVKWLAHLQHPDMFKDMNMKAEVSKFYKDVYGYAISEQELSTMLDHTTE